VEIGALKVLRSAHDLSGEHDPYAKFSSENLSTIVINRPVESMREDRATLLQIWDAREMLESVSPSVQKLQRICNNLVSRARKIVCGYHSFKDIYDTCRALEVDDYVARQADRGPRLRSRKAVWAEIGKMSED
jgi:hypothetical protein